MCVLVMKNDKDGKLLCVESRIVVLGKFEDRLYQNSQRYAPVLKYIYLRLLTAKAVGDKHILQKGYCNNSFCNAPSSRKWCHGNKTSHWRPGFPGIWIMAPQEKLYGLCQYPIVVKTWSKVFWSRWASILHHIYPASFRVYFLTPSILTSSPQFNPNSTLASMLTILCFTHSATPPLPENDVTVIRPSIGDPYFQKYE